MAATSSPESKAPAARKTLLEGPYLRRLEALKLVSRTRTSAGLKGEQRAKLRGSGMEFADYREYVPGDDIRNVDWSAYLRLDKLLVRQFEESGDIATYFFLDASDSMSADPARFELAKKIIAALSYVALHNLDRVNVAAFSDGINSALERLRGRTQAMRLLDFLSRVEPQGETSIQASLRAFFARPRKRGLVVLVSDFFDPNWQEGLRELVRLQQDVIAIYVRSRDDYAPDLPHDALLFDRESGQELRIRTTPELLQDYRNQLDAHRTTLAQECARRGFSFVTANSTGTVDDVVLELQRRGRLLR